jgi:uncharacterized protein YcnI
MTTEKEKAELGTSTIKSFFEQFGNDKYSEIIIECLLKELLNVETVSLLSKSQQTGNKTDHDTEWQFND